jgi:hypothetical protein
MGDSGDGTCSSRVTQASTPSPLEIQTMLLASVQLAMAVLLHGPGTPMWAPSQIPSRAPLPGVWRTVEVRSAKGEDITDRKWRTLWIFTRQHFSIAGAETDRPVFSGPVTDAQKVAMWNDFGAQVGSYELVGDTLILHSELAKSPVAMKPGSFQKYRVTVEKNALWIQLIADASGPLPNQERARLMRIE